MVLIRHLGYNIQWVKELFLFHQGKYYCLSRRAAFAPYVTHNKNDIPPRSDGIR